MIERITRRRAPAFWFERMREPRPDGGGAIRVAIWCHTTRPRRASRQPSPRAGTKTSGEHILRSMAKRQCATQCAWTPSLRRLRSESAVLVRQIEPVARRS